MPIDFADIVVEAPTRDGLAERAVEPSAAARTALRALAGIVTEAMPPLVA